MASLSRLAVTLVLSSASPLQVGHRNAQDTARVLVGDHAGDATLNGATTTASRDGLGSVEVSTPGQVSAAVSTLGDTINARIFGGGEPDGMVGFDAAMRDPSSPGALRADFGSGDHLQPDDAGYRSMGDSVILFR